MFASFVFSGAFALTAIVSFLFTRRNEGEGDALRDALICIGAAMAFGTASIFAYFAGASLVNAALTMAFALAIGSAAGSILPELLGTNSALRRR